MTAEALPGRVRTLGPADEAALRRLFADDPVGHCFAEARLDAGGLGEYAAGGAFWGYGPAGSLSAALLVGANLVPVRTDHAARAAFADLAVQRGRRSSSIVGPAEEVLDLWRLLEPVWGPAREVRPDQHLMVAVDPPAVAPDAALRLAVPADIPTLFPACVDMFTEEVGVSPTAGGMEFAYRRRVGDLVADGRAFVHYDESGPAFKAEIGALSRRACQIQGVWTRPDLRRQGRASSGMAAVTALAARRAPVVSLYVNGFNEGALRAYRAAGFRTVGRYATVLF